MTSQMIEYLAQHWIVLLLTFIYLVFCLWVGWYFWARAEEGVESFYVARREIPDWVVSLAFFQRLRVRIPIVARLESRFSLVSHGHGLACFGHFFVSFHGWFLGRACGNRPPDWDR